MTPADDAMIPAYHFTAAALRDGSPIPPIGEWLEHTGPLVLCESGLHASIRLLDALRYAPGLTLHRVTLDGETLTGDDKLVARRRRIDETREVPLRAVMRLACESAALAAWCAGLYLPELVTAAEAADREDWADCERAASAAARAASDAASAAAGDAARSAARAAGDAASNAAWAAAGAAAGAAAKDCLEARAVALLWGES